MEGKGTLIQRLDQQGATKILKKKPRGTFEGDLTFGRFSLPGRKGNQNGLLTPSLSSTKKTNKTCDS